MAYSTRCLEWLIHNPFLPSEKTFNTQFEHTTHAKKMWWEATLTVTRPRLENWAFSFTLQCIQPGVEQFAVIAKLTIEICVNKDILFEKGPFDCIFRNEEYYELNGDMRPGRCHFRIKVEISIGELPESRHEELPESRHEELEGLSKDLETLLKSSIYSDLCLHSNPDDSDYRVHRSIMRARWNNFGVHHDIDADIVGIDISKKVLNDILFYMYTGDGKLAKLKFVDIKYMAELNRVIQHYELSYLYWNFHEEPMKKVVRVINAVFSIEKKFSVIGTSSLLVRKSWNDRPMINNPEVEIRFKFEYCLGRANPQFSYSIHYISPIKLYALVTIVYQKGWGKMLTKTVHEHEQSLSLDGGRRSWTSWFIGDLRQFREFIVDRNIGRSVPDSLRIILYISSGELPEEITYEGAEVPNQQERLEVLSDHMFGLMEIRNPDTIMRINCLGDNPATFEYCNREIFTARVRGWENVIREVIQEEEPDADVVECDVSSSCFRHVLHFIYTGTIFDVSYREAREMREMLNFVRNGSLGYARAREFLNLWLYSNTSS